MKKIILFLFVSLPISVYAARTTEADIKQLNNYNSTEEIQQVMRNRLGGSPQTPNWICDIVLTDETTGKSKKEQAATRGNGITVAQSASEYVFEESDDTGASSMVVDKKTRKGSVTLWDANGKITHTGRVINCR